MNVVMNESAQVPQVDREPAEKIKVFISYSRQDGAFVGQLVDNLTSSHEIHVFRDTNDILPTEEWKKRLEKLIGQADTIVFCLSQASAKSHVCAWEVQFAESLNKRIAPVLLEDVGNSETPIGLAKLNYVLFTDPNEFDQSVTKLVGALRTNIDWIREHTRIGELARHWLASGRPSDQLLRGTELTASRSWVTARPHTAPNLSESMIDYLEAGRNREFRILRQRRLFQGSLLCSAVVISGIWFNFDSLRERLHWQVMIQSSVLSSEQEKALQPGDRFQECMSACPQMVVLSPGNFFMGTGKDRHEVTISKPFAVSKFEVTFAQWDSCVAAGACPKVSDNKWGRKDRPVLDVNWYEAKRYVEWLSRVTKRQYRLLTEAEWEYSARAGTNTRYSWGDELGVGHANCNGCGSKWDNQRTAPVGSFSANNFGVHDMHGNVWEWVEDCWHGHRNFSGAPTDGSAWVNDGCERRVARGDSYVLNENFVHSGARDGVRPIERYNAPGIRVARTLRELSP